VRGRGDAEGADDFGTGGEFGQGGWLFGMAPPRGANGTAGAHGGGEPRSYSMAAWRPWGIRREKPERRGLTIADVP
jgi:hypothetical protein